MPVEALVFNTPTEIQYEQKVELRLVVQPGAEAEQLEATFEASRKENQTGDLQSAEARLSEEVGATLISPSLVVTPLTPERQFVSRIEPTEWRWAVTGSAEGQHELSLSLYAILPERSSVRVLKTYDRTITVQVPNEQRVMRFVKGHWEWLWSIALAPLGAWALAWWRRRKLQGETG